jgi:hypothetical protein
MWKSKSCPEGLPQQKNGAMASRQAPARTSAREIGLLSNWDLPSFDIQPHKWFLISYRKDWPRLSRIHQQGKPGLLRKSNSIASKDSRKINRPETIGKG